jgi:aspartate/methionine/tyrosine aminotransferase
MPHSSGLAPFKLERYFARYEFKVEFLLSSSDCESLTQAELLRMASPESLALWQELRLGYTESPGHPMLRQEVASLYTHIPVDNVVIAAPEEAIFIAMHTLLAPNDHVIVISPAYQSLYEIARSIGCRVTPWRLQTGSDGWQLDLSHLERSITNHTRLLVINFPHNPTGFLPSRSQLDALLLIARKHDLYIFSDEMYRFLEYDSETQLASICDVYEKGIALSGLSKSLALPGLRIGWLTSQDSAWAGRWLALKDYTTICNSAPSEILGIIALQNKSRILRRNLEIIHANLAYANQFFSGQIQFFSWLRPQAGSVAFPQWLGDGSVEHFCQRLLDDQGVMLVPGSIFDFPGDHFRLGLGRKNFPEAIERVKEYLES